MCMCLTTMCQTVRQKQIQLRRDTDKSTVVFGDFNTSLRNGQIQQTENQ